MSINILHSYEGTSLVNQIKNQASLIIALFTVLLFLSNTLYYLFVKKQSKIRILVLFKSIKYKKKLSLPKKANDVFHIYEAHWEKLGVAVKPEYVILSLINNNPTNFIDIKIFFALILPDKTPLKNFRVIGGKNEWQKKIQIIKGFETRNLPIANIGSFYKGKISVKLEAKRGDSLKKTTSRNVYEFDNSLIFHHKLLERQSK